jgi:Na+-driven multidrug efflux pump
MLSFLLAAPGFLYQNTELLRGLSSTRPTMIIMITGFISAFLNYILINGLFGFPKWAARVCGLTTLIVNIRIGVSPRLFI